MDIGEIQQDDILYEKALELRYELFFKKHHLPKEILNDEQEIHSKHIAIFHKKELIAYGRLSALGNGEFQISQMVVSPSYQKQGYGTKLLLKLMEVAKDKEAKAIILKARTTATSFYKKQGFQPKGEVYSSSSTGVPHIKMVYHANI